MRRRELLGGLAATAAAWPLAARGQEPPTVGFFIHGSAAGYAAQTTAFRRGLEEAGFREGQNVRIIYQWTDGQLDRIPAMAAELVKIPVSVLVANGGTVRAARVVGKAIPIVFIGGGDPVQSGLVASFNRPGGNITGIVQLGGALGAKRLELLQQFVPKMLSVSLLTNPDGPTAKLVSSDVHAAAKALNLRVQSLTARNEDELKEAISRLEQGVGHALLVSADPFFLSQRVLLISLVAQKQVPAIYDFRDYAVSGGLMSYGASLSDAYRQLGTYAGRILKGEKPADLPVLQPSKFEFVINLKTAQALKFAVPDRLLALADEVIE